MNREQKKKLSRAKRRMQNEKRTRMEKELEDMEPVEDDMPEEIEKSYSGNYEAKSFSELDIAIDAQEKAEEVQETTWMVQDLVRNIIWYPEYSPEEKASAIKSVADEFGTRVRTIMESPMQKDASEDIDALEIEATLARDQRNLSLPEKIKDAVTKAVVSTAAENKMPDSNFALVVERDGKKVRKYLIHDKAHVRNALARAAQMIKKGGEAGADAKAALPKIRAAAKKMGIDVSMEKEDNAVQIEKDANGDWRAVMWVSNNYLDRDNEIISEAAHKEYVDWVNNNRELMPASISWHIPETVKENHVDFMDYIDGFLVASVKLTEKEAESLLTLSKKVNLGMSHGSFVLERDPNDQRVITKYRMYEVSDLPLKNAANPFTDLETISKEAGMDKLEYLTELLGADKAKAYVEKIGLKKQALEEAEIESKEVVEEEVVVTDEQTTTEEEKKPEQETNKELIEQVFKELDIEGLNEFVMNAKASMDKINALEELVKELTADKDEKLAELIDPPISKKMAWSRPSESEDNVLKENKQDNKLKESVPGIPKEYWLSEATGTTPIKEEVV